MSSQEERKKVRKRALDSQEAQPDAPAAAERKDTSGVDELVDEIDQVLEENAEEFVRSYVQKGGQ